MNNAGLIAHVYSKVYGDLPPPTEETDGTHLPRMFEQIYGKEWTGHASAYVLRVIDPDPDADERLLDPITEDGELIAVVGLIEGANIDGLPINMSRTVLGGGLPTSLQGVKVVRPGYMGDRSVRADG